MELQVLEAVASCSSNQVQSFLSAEIILKINVFALLPLIKYVVQKDFTACNIPNRTTAAN